MTSGEEDGGSVGKRWGGFWEAGKVLLLLFFNLFFGVSRDVKS